MNSFSFDTKSLKLLFYRYRDTKIYAFFIFVLILVVCSLLVMWIVLPEVQKYISIKDEADALSQKVALLQSNIDYIKGSNPSEVQQDLQTALSALPSEKDFVGMLNAISASALISGITLDDFSANIGKLATESGGLLTPIPVKLTMKADMPTAMKFMNELATKVPVSDISLIEISDNDINKSSTIQTKFYYQPLGNVVFHEDAPIPHLSQKQKELLQKVKGWKDSLNGIQSVTPSIPASASGGI